MSTCELRLPWPPTVNHYKQLFTYGKGKKPLIKLGLSKRAREYRTEALVAIRDQLGPGIDPVISRMSMRVLFYPPCRRERDLDNYVKAIQDAMQAAHVYRSDSQIDRVLLVRREVRPPGHVEVKLRLLPRKLQKRMFEANTDAPF